MNANSALNTQLRAHAASVGALCAEIERGQAFCPLGDKVSAAIGESLATPSLVLLADSVETRARFLAALSTIGLKAVEVRREEALGVVSLKLGRHGRCIGDALPDMPGFPDTGGSAGCDTDSVPGDISLLFPEVVATPFTVPRIATRLVQDLGVLVLAGTVDSMLSSAGEAAIEPFAERADLIIPVVCGGIPAGIDGWWNLRAVHRRKSLRVQNWDDSTVGLAGLARIFTSTSVLREHVAAARCVGQLANVLSFVIDRSEQEQRQLIGRVKREQRREREATPQHQDQTLRQTQDLIRTEISEWVARMTLALRENGRRETLRDGSLRQACAAILDELAEADFSRDEGLRTIRLRMSDSACSRTVRALKKTLRKSLEVDLVLLRDEVQALRRSLDEHLRSAGLGDSQALQPLPDEQKLWETLREAVVPEFRYRGEVPKRGFLQRLGEGRKVLFVLLMAISLAGTILGVNMRSYRSIGVLLLVIFIIAVVYTFRSWKQDSGEALAREVERARDALRPELERVASDVSKEKLGRLMVWLDETKRQGLASMESTLRGALGGRQEAMEEEARSSRSNLKLIDARLRSQQNHLQRCMKLKNDIADLRRNIENGLFRDTDTGGPT